MRENFQQEVGIMKELDHPNICTVYESYDHGRHVYLVMEYCAGGAPFGQVWLLNITGVEVYKKGAFCLSWERDQTEFFFRSFVGQSGDSLLNRLLCITTLQCKVMISQA